jgi:thioesterase domain-containing protein
MCRGAHIAFEMARRLEQEGETVALVGILDTWVLENTYNRLLFVEYYLRRLTSLLRRGRVDQSPSSKEKADANGNARDPTTATAERTGAIHKNPMYEVYFPGADFVPKTYPGRVTVFRARRQPLNRIRDAQLGWGTLAEGGVGVHIIPGKHGNVLREPNVQGLAGELKKCLLLNRTEENPA